MSADRHLPLYLSPEHACGYLPERLSRNVTVSPDVPMSTALYAQLLERGFRRSGEHVYRPYCAHCRQCLPARVVVGAFQPQRAQQRCWRHNADLTWHITDTLGDEHYALFQRYLNGRHAGAGMDGGDREAFHQFLECSWGATEFWEFRQAHRLLGVAVVDVLPRALSAVYTFFDPDENRRSLGVYAVLMQIEQARRRGRPHVYLGYWVEGSRKMDYKRRYQPLELHDGVGWHRHGAPVAVAQTNADNARPS